MEQFSFWNACGEEKGDEMNRRLWRKRRDKVLTPESLLAGTPPGHVNDQREGRKGGQARKGNQEIKFPTNAIKKLVLRAVLGDIK